MSSIVAGQSLGSGPINSSTYLIKAKDSSGSLKSGTMDARGVVPMDISGRSGMRANTEDETSGWLNDNMLKVAGVVESIVTFSIGVAGVVSDQPGLAACGFASSLIGMGWVAYCCCQRRRTIQSSHITV